MTSLFFVNIVRSVTILMIFLTRFLFLLFPLLFLFSISLISALIFMISFLLLALGLSALLFLDSWAEFWWLIWDSSSFLMYTFSAINFLLSNALAMSFHIWLLIQSSSRSSSQCNKENKVNYKLIGRKK